jgi:hypothetical protein
MIGAKRRSNPLNLMRVMPPKEARLGHAIFRAWFFISATDEHRFSQIQISADQLIGVSSV